MFTIIIQLDFINAIKIHGDHLAQVLRLQRKYKFFKQ